VRRTGYAQIDGLSIAYQVHGEGPPLIFQPGYMTNIDQNWEWPAYARFLERIGSFAQLILVDRRGTGLSDRTPPHAAFEDTMDDIRAVMDALDLPRAALFGAGEGGPTCMLFAATFPERTSALALYCPYVTRRWAPDVPWGITPEQRERALRAIDDRWGRAAIGVHLYAPSAADDPAFVEWYVRSERAGGTPGAARSWYEMTLDIDVRSVLPAIRVPTLLLHRTEDQALSIESSRYAAERIPGVRYVELPGRDHFLFLGDADALLDEVEEFTTGVRPAAPVDRLLATILFTDIVGSTERAAQLGDREWRGLLARHYEITRAEVERYRGKVQETTGDGVKATFDGPARAIRAARSVSDRVASIGLQIRAGLHSGEVELRDGAFGGIAVHIAARVMALAGPGEVLVSSTVKDLVIGSGMRFADRGIHTLKGVPDDWHLFVVER